ncbi:MAG: recombinase family protein, partial [Aestuariivita sp.]|nr:recombinase family protein [Aestuariivita sp.]
MSARPSRSWRTGASRGIRVHCLALGGADLTSPAGQMTMTVINAVAQFERDLLVERTQSGLARAQGKGRHTEIDVSETSGPRPRPGKGLGAPARSRPADRPSCASGRPCQGQGLTPQIRDRARAGLIGGGDPHREGRNLAV